jgi:glycosyltransferase involved in cell wall biosynthesis
MNAADHVKRILVVMPAHNEAGRIGAVIRGIKAVLPAADVAVVNDASTDETAGEARAEGAAVLTHAVNMGYGASLETAFLFAMQKGYDGVVQMDADGQHLPGELDALLAPLRAGTADIVIGSRYSGGERFPTPWLRRFGQLFFGGILFVLTRRWFADPTSGFQALNGRALRLFSSGVFPCDYPDADVLLMAHLAGLRIREVPVRMAPRSGGVSIHSGWKPLYYGIKMLLSVFVVLLNTPVWRGWRGRLGPA